MGNVISHSHYGVPWDIRKLPVQKPRQNTVYAIYTLTDSCNQGAICRK